MDKEEKQYKPSKPSLLAAVSSLASQRKANRQLIEDQDISLYHRSLELIRLKDKEAAERKGAEEKENRYWNSREKEWRQQKEEERKQRAANRQARKQLSRVEVYDKIDELIWSNLGRLTSETRDNWLVRIKKLRKDVRDLWHRSREPILANQPRYVEGLPASLIARPPRPLPHFPQISTGRLSCLHCSVKDMFCSHTRVLSFVNQRGPCSRCLRSGDRCLVYHGGPGEPWRFADGPSTWFPEVEEDEKTARHRRDEQKALVEELKYQVVGEKAGCEIIGSHMRYVEHFRFPLPRWNRDGLLNWRHMLGHRGIEDDLARKGDTDGGT